MAKRNTKTADETRIFHYARDGKVPFSVTTTLTDEEAIALLRAKSNDFARKCADAIEKAQVAAQHPNLGIRVSQNMLAWGFRIAEQKPVSLCTNVLNRVRFRRPFYGDADGNPFKVALCGPNSSHPGEYAITDGQGFSRTGFYGYALPDGTWEPRSTTPEAIVKALTE